MDRAEYLASYCASIDCKSKKLGDCDLCMYEKGRADKDKELSELPNQYSEKLWKNAYNRGRANAIDEFAEKMKPIATKWFTYGCMYLGDIDTLAEQLKEQNK